MTEIEPLHIPREKLKERIEEKLAEDKKKWDEKRAEQEKADEEELAKLREAMEKNPVAVLELVRERVTIEEFKTGEKFVEHLGRLFPHVKPEFKPDERATKLVRVLELASDETIEVQPSDDYYTYL